MTLELRYAVRSDVGLLREGNEDSAYAGPRLLAVADGMGGHAAGEVASAVAIGALADLDEDMPPSELQIALSTAVAHANQILHDMVSADPSITGMGTTLTAMLWSGSKVALCHIGDSRAYVLSGGQFQQITHDHTLVQSLVDDGRISPDEAATHPQRSLLLRALDGTSEAEPDLSILEARAGDRYLLCSDGLSGVVSEETLHRTLATVPDPDDAVRQLVELAIRGGGPDNITCIVADVVDSVSAPRSPGGSSSMLAGAASNGGRPTVRTDSPAARAHLLSQTTPQAAVVVDHDDPAPRMLHGDEGDEPPRRRLPIVRSLIVLLLILVVGAGYLGWRYTQDQYFVGTDGGQVAIFQGVNQSVAGVSLSHVYQRTDIPVVQVPSPQQGLIRATIPATSRASALAIVARVRGQYEACLTAYAAQAKYTQDLNNYNAAKAAYKKQWGDLQPHKLPKNRGTVHPPKFSETQPTTPPGCPGPAATSGAGTGSGS
jgi:PPM family protein phosphatase